LVDSLQSGLGNFKKLEKNFQKNFLPQSRVSIGVPMLLIAWSITEVIRYSFYALNLINAVPSVLIWMR